ncbi:MAG: putative Ig domain-containing protein, partial [Nanoarchaeota archaeon]
SEIHDYDVPNANAPLTIAQAENLGYVNGVIDEVSVYDRALRDDELRAIAVSGQAGKCKQFQISTNSPLFAQIDQYAVFQFEAIFGKEPLLWSIINGTLPQGMVVYSNGVLNGTPSGVGNFTFTVKVKDAQDQITQKDFVLEVVLELPPVNLSVDKVGTQVVPGQDADYFIMVENVGLIPTTKVNSSELLEPWFTFLNASPYPNSIVNTSDGWPLPANESMFNESSYQTFLQWEIPPLQPGNSYLIHYSVNVDPTFPVGDEVTGTFCLTPEEAESCRDLYKECLAAAMIGCISSQDKKCVEAGVPTCVYLWGSCLWKENSDGCSSHKQPASGSFDPNQKTVLPEKYALANQTLTYIIDFENIGNADAKTVRLFDEL